MHTLHEGEGTTLVRPDGSIDATDVQEFKGTSIVANAEMGTITLHEVYARTRDAIREVLSQQERLVFEKVEAAAASVGNAVEAQGRPLDADLLLEVWERVWIDFNPDGRPRLPMITVPPGAQEKMEIAVKQLEEEPFRSRLAVIIERKKEEWHDREDRRKLVD